MELEEAEDEEWNNNNNYKGGSGSGSGSGKACRVLALGKRMLVAGFIASSAPIVLPPLLVASAIGLAVSMPYALFFATHACTQNLMSRLLPTPQQHACFHPHIIAHDNDDMHIQKEQQGDDDIQQFKTPYEVTSVVFEESEDQDIEEAELQRETKGLLEKIREGGAEYKVDNTNDSQDFMAEASQVLDETTAAETVGDLLIEIQDYNISVAEDSSEITTEKTDMHMIVTQEPRALLDRPITLQEGELDNKNSQLHEYNEIMDSSGADARETADDEEIIDPEVSTYSIDLHEESSNVVVDEHTDPMGVPDSSVGNKFRPSECSSGEDNIMCPSHQVVFDEESIWKQINVIRKIIGYEGATQASCADELKALYIFTGVEPPTFLKENSTAEINEKLHFLKSIVGIK